MSISGFLDHFCRKTPPKNLELPGLTFQPPPLQQRVPPQIPHIPLLQNLQNGPFKASAKRYSKRTDKNTGKFALFRRPGCWAHWQPSTDTFSFHSHCSCVISERVFGERLGSERTRKTRRLPRDKSNIYTGFETGLLCTSPLLAGSLPARLAPFLHGAQHLQSTA